MARNLLRWLVLGLFIGVALGAIAGLVLSRFVRLPAVEALTTYRPSAATQVRARDGSLIATFANERRIPLPAEQIPRVFRDAVIAVEDANFYRHTGVDPKGIARAVVRNALSRKRGMGGSTITQQLARTLFLTPEKRWTRKVQEAVLAVEIEQRFSKDQIFTMYANQVNFGHGHYGVEAAARFYFGKHASDLTLPEAALLAGVPQRPTSLSPITNPDRARGRRNHVLDRMLEEGFIDERAHEVACAAPIDASPHYDRNPSAEYFIEEVRRSVEDRFGSRQMLEGGLTVETTLDPGLQPLAENAVREGLVALQRRLGWPGARRNLLDEGVTDLEAWRHASWPFLRWGKGELAFAVVTDVGADSAELRLGGRVARLPVAGAKWTGRSSLLRLIKRGDLVLVRLGEASGENRPLEVELEPEPGVEASLVVLDNRSGAVLALVGGFDFDRSQFDRAVQAKRQCGSAFKPFVYLAAFERGMQPNDTVLDAPILLPDESGVATYSPLNYYRRFFGLVTLREAVEHSLNASAVKVQQMVTGAAAIDVARRMGIDEPLHPYASLALGSFEIAPIEITAAYAALGNRGQHTEPHMINRVVDAEGKAILEVRPEVTQAIGEDVAYLMTHVLEGVVQRGTGVKAAALGAHIAGKTGTTDRYTDAWFIGYTPRVTCGVWVGRDMKQPIGRRMTGAEAALPTWIDFMKGYFELSGEQVRAEEFPVPAGVTLIPVDRRTGLRASPECGDQAILEAVLEGHEPGECTPTAHALAALPWPDQIPLYTYKPGEPETTPEAAAAAAAKIAGEKD